jgi:lipopolysaccharide/colanic/teichoic acid biosynthesis glycosyltransferase
MALRNKNLNMQKTMVRDLPWGSTRPGTVLTVPGPPASTVIRPTYPGTADPHGGTSDVVHVKRGGTGASRLFNTVLSKAIVSPSFLFSSLLVFLFVPDAVLKGHLSLNLRARAIEAARRLIDMSLASILLLLTAPAFLIVPILIKLDSPGSVIYRQVRVGQNRRRDQRRRNPYRLKGDRRNGDRRRENHHGMLFMVYKFRSMHEDAEKKSGPVWARQGDPRVTKVGKILRATRMDELPQLFNILKGEMSLVGPRPERPHFVDQFVNDVTRYSDRLQVKPGLTGLAQVMAGYDTCMEDVCEKLQHDLTYIQQRSLGQDIRILLKTIGVVLTGKGVYE